MTMPTDMFSSQTMRTEAQIWKFSSVHKHLSKYEFLGINKYRDKLRI